MTQNKRYYWLKLKEDFFDEKCVKYLRRLDRGEFLVIVYLKMQLKSLKNNGKIYFERILPCYESEIALAIDESEEDVKNCIDALLKINVAEVIDGGTLFLLELQKYVGSESYAAERMRNFRARKREGQQCNNVTQQRNDETLVFADVNRSDEEIEKEKDINNIYCRASTTVDDKKVLDIKQNQSSDTIKQIIDYLNQKTGKNFKPTTAETKRHINARLKDGFTVNDFFTVIDTKVNQWLNSPDMCKYLRPSTLFSTKFESYLNENGGNRTEGQRQQGQAEQPQERIYNDDSDDFHDWSKEKLDAYIESVKDEPQTV